MNGIPNSFEGGWTEEVVVVTEITSLSVRLCPCPAAIDFGPTAVSLVPIFLSMNNDGHSLQGRNNAERREATGVFSGSRCCDTGRASTSVYRRLEPLK